MSDPPRDGALSPRSFAMAHQRRQSFVGCSKIHDYEIQCKLGEGTFGEVHRARAKKTGALVALKKIIMHNEKDGFPITALREIRLLKLLSHTNILRLEDMAVEHSPRKNDKRKRTIMYMVTPYMDHDLSGLLDNPSVRFTEPQIKCYMLQLLEGLRYLHDNHILHRDMKAANLLINNKGILQIADFGLARHYDGEVPKPGQGGGEGNRDYTSLVVTRWYRPPELLMELRKYTTAIDLWGVGCVFGEMLVGKPILTGESDGHQLEIIFDLCGTPTDQTMPGWRSLPGAAVLQPRPRPSTISQRFRDFGAGAISLLKELLKLDWQKRINAIDALQHPYFRNAPLPAAPADLPSFEASHELDRRKFHDRRAVLPPAPKGGTVGRGALAAAGPAGIMEGVGYNGDTYAGGGRNGNGRNGHNDGRYGRGRVPPPPPAGDQHIPAWHRERGLPPRPPPAAEFASGRDASSGGGGPGGMAGGDRDRPPRSRGGRSNRDDVDTYIPRYDGDSRRHRDEPWDNRRRADDWDRRRGGGPGGGNGAAGGAGGDLDERSRTSQTRSRSRSPMREREWERERDRDRRR